MSEIGFETFKYHLKTLNLALSSQKANLFIDAHNTIIEIIGKIILEDNIQNIVSIIGYIIEELISRRKILILEGLDFNEISLSFIFGGGSKGINLQIKSKTLKEVINNREIIKAKDLIKEGNNDDNF